MSGTFTLKPFLTCETDFVQILTVLENCLAHGLRQLLRDTEVTSVVYDTYAP